MTATTIMLIAFGALILEHWANSEPTVSIKTLLEMVFAIIVIAMLDQGEAEPIAKGFAWLFLVAVLLSNHSILGVLQKAGNAPANQPKPKTTPSTGVQLA